MSERVPLETFRSLSNGEFQMLLPDGQRLALEIVSVRDLGERRTEAGPLSCYSLVFCSPGEKRAAAQGTYRLENAALGAMDIFLVPIGPDSVGMRYEAIFN